MDQDHPDLREIEEGQDLPDREVKEDLTEDRVHEDRQGHEDQTDLLEYPDQLGPEVSVILVFLYSIFKSLTINEWFYFLFIKSISVS